MAKIVFCDDSTLIQKMIQMALRSTEHEVYIASDGAEGLALIERERPALVFTDVSMPELDGFQLAEALKARPALAHIPVVFVTAAEEAQVEQARARGAADFLIKPFNAVELRAKVDALLSSSGA
jgi:CheY-like chemotaxis protein